MIAGQILFYRDNDQIQDHHINSKAKYSMGKMRERDYIVFLQEIKEKIREAQYKALKAVNRELISLYWEIGKSIIEKQEQEGWGKSVVETLSKDVQIEFPGIKGFSVQNLWYRRQIYLEYRASEKLQPLVGEISWSQFQIVNGINYGT